MNTQPLVSVAIITYNHKEFLREAIESILSQNYRPLQLVIGDDCSTDGTQNMLKEYEAKFPSLFVLKLSRKNMGITANSNAVHFACTGEYIAWMGGDDLMLPGKIKKQVEFMETHPYCNISYHNLSVFDSDTQQHMYYYNEKEHYQGGVKTMIKHGTFNGACSSMYRRAASPAEGFSDLFPVASDWFYSIQHLMKGGKIKFINEVLGKYRRHSGNVSGKKSPLAARGFQDHLETCFYIIKNYPAYANDARYRLSVIYRQTRGESYIPNLVKSLSYYPLGIKTLALLFIHFLSFKKLKP